MKLLVVGGGGREHALAWKAAQSPRVDEVLVAPGNAGTAREAGIRNVPVDAEDLHGLVRLAQEEQVHLTLVGPEAPLVAGITDAFREAGLRCFGPGRAAARLEGSKAFAKSFLERHGIPTAAHRTFDDPDAASAWIRSQTAPLVIKASGLAAGKGVVIPESPGEAEAAARDMLEGTAFGDAGREIVVEEFLTGQEVSFIVLTDGEHVVPLASSQDHKARDDGDRGPNTGGMGAYSPAPAVTPALHQRILDEVIEPTVRGLAKDGLPYQGFLYAGLMITDDGDPKVLEFNCRFGDPEAQPLLMRLQSDLVTLCDQAIDGRLPADELAWDDRPALGVVLAARGYPGAYAKGERIESLPPDTPDAKIFHSGTREGDAGLETAGGRVLTVCALGSSVAEAQRRAYQVVDQIRWPGAYFRTDIGHRAIRRNTPPA